MMSLAIYLVRGATQDVLESSPSSSLIVLIEFPDMDTVKTWYSSEEYSKVLIYKDRALRRKLTFLEGVS